MPKSGLDQAEGRDPLKVSRRLFLAIFVFCVVGTGGELLLLEHFKEFWQKVPLVLMAAGVIVLGVHAFHQEAASVRVFQGLMILFLVSGGTGLILHYRGNVEFELEMHPAARGF